MPYYDPGKNIMLDDLAASITHVSLHTADPTASGSNEVSGGSPAYARKTIAWNSAASGNLDSSSQPTFDVPPGMTITHIGFWSALTAGTILASKSITAEAFAGQGQFQLTDADLSIT